MKKNIIICFSMLLSCSTVLANLSGTDDFNDNTMDPAKWSVLGFAGSSFSEANSHLENLGGPGDTGGAWEWTPNHGSYVDDWSISIDVVNSLDETSLSDQRIGFGLVVWDESPFINNFSHSLSVGDDAGGSNPWRRIKTDAEESGVQVFNQQTAVSEQSVYLQISFDASAKILTSSFDIGSGLTTLTNYNIAGWGMTDSDVFTVAVYGSGVDVSSSGQAYGDNFVAVPEPGTLGLLVVAAVGLLLARGNKRERCD